MSIKKENTLILGGGLAGLSACYHGDGVVYEKDITDGGHARSHSSDGFIFDEGIHVLHTSNEYILSLCEDLGVNLEMKDRDAWIHSHGVMTRYPFQANTYGTNSQPYYVFLDNKENPLIENANYQDYGSVNLFKDWLNRGLEEFNN